MTSISETLEMLHEHGELMSSTNALIRSPPIRLEEAFNPNMKIWWVYVINFSFHDSKLIKNCGIFFFAF